MEDLSSSLETKLREMVARRRALSAENDALTLEINAVKAALKVMHPGRDAGERETAASFMSATRQILRASDHPMTVQACADRIMADQGLWSGLETRVIRAVRSGMTYMLKKGVVRRTDTKDGKILWSMAA